MYVHVHAHVVRPGDLLPAVVEARSSGNDSKVTRILAGAMKQLKHSRLKPDLKLNEDLTALVKEDSQMFNKPAIIEVYTCTCTCTCTCIHVLTHYNILLRCTYTCTCTCCMSCTFYMYMYMYIMYVYVHVYVRTSRYQCTCIY